jgi:hypothetical protein
MLTAYIIEELLRIRREKASFPEIFIELPEFEDQLERLPEKNEKDDPEEKKRGVIIIDFTI